MTTYQENQSHPRRRSSSIAASLLSLTLIAVPGYANSVAGGDTTATISASAEDRAIRPFRVTVPEAALVDLRKRVLATRWPERETVDDQSQGPQLAKLQELVSYWGTDYDWRKVEAKLNALPMFVTKIDGVDIQFIHVKSRHPKAMPLVITHGWPGSILEITKAIGPLTDPDGPWRSCRGRVRCRHPLDARIRFLR